MDEFQQAIQNLRDQANTWLATLPPLEQAEASQDLVYCLKSLESMGNRLVEMTAAGMAAVASAKAKFVSDATVTAESTARQKLLDGGEFILKADAQLATDAAVTTAETNARAAMQAEFDTRNRVVTRRATIISDKRLVSVVAEKLPDGMLAGDDFEAQVSKIAERVGKLKALGLTEERSGAVFAELCVLPVDEAGDAAFAARFGTIEQAARDLGGRTPANPLVVPSPAPANPSGRKHIF